MSCAKQRDIQNSWIEKLETAKRTVIAAFPNFDMRNLTAVMGRIGHFHYNSKKSMILGEEKKLYNFLIDNSLNPYTFYKWLLLERVPDEVRFMLNQKQISQKKAISLAFEQKHENNSELAEEIFRIGKSLIRGM